MMVDIEECPRCSQESPEDAARARETALAVIEAYPDDEPMPLWPMGVAAGISMWDALDDGRYVCGRCDSLWGPHEGSLVMLVDGSCDKCHGFECPGRPEAGMKCENF